MSKNTNLSFLTDYITADITNGRIGINNASPTVAFDVSGITKFSSSVTAADLIISDTYLNDPLIKLVTTTSGNVEVQMRTATTTYNAGIGVVTSGYDFGLFTNNTTRMTITSIGAVAIGATAITDPYTATGGGWQTVQFGKGGILGAYRTDNESMTGFNTYVSAPDGANKAIISGVGGSAIRYYSELITFNTISSSGTAQTQNERMRITSVGNVGIGNTAFSNTRVTITSLGTTSSNYGLVVNNSSNSNLFLVRDDGVVQVSTSNVEIWNANGLKVFTESNGAYWLIRAYNAVSNQLRFNYQGTDLASIATSTGNYTALSDINKKKDFEQSEIGLNEVLGLKPTLYRMKTEDDTQDKHLGFIAQEVKQFIPQAYSETGEGDDKFIGLTEMPIIAALTKAIQEQQAQIEELKTLLKV